MDILEKKLEAAGKVDEFRKKTLKDLLTELNSAVGYAELCRRHGAQIAMYLDKLSIVHGNMEKTISFALGESIDDDTDAVDVAQIDALQGKRILLVEDNELNLEMLEEVLLDHGLLVEKANNGNKAISAVEEHDPGYYQFILMDIEMPEMNGYEATKAIRNMHNRPDNHNIPIIAMTANAFAEDVQASLDAGMNGHLSKPIQMDEVIKTIARNLDR